MRRCLRAVLNISLRRQALRISSATGAVFRSIPVSHHLTFSQLSLTRTMASAPKTIRRLEYAPPDYSIDRINLVVDIHDGYTITTATLTVAPRGGNARKSLLLHKGKHLTLESVTVDGAAVVATVTEDGMFSIPVPGACEVVTTSRVFPEKNTELEGLYKEASGTNYVTQCEAEGFREISPFIDRPDNLSVYTVKVGSVLVSAGLV
jgi:aminopeptidase N